MEKLAWFDRKFNFGHPIEMLPYFQERLAGTAARLEHKLRGVSDEILRHQPEGKWSIKQNIGHLAEVNEIALIRLNEIARGISPMSPAVFETRQDYNSQPLRDVIRYFTSRRTRSLFRYQSLSDSDLSRSSLHPRLRVSMTPVDLAYFDAEHDDHHLLRITEILAGWDG